MARNVQKDGKRVRKLIVNGYTMRQIISETYLNKNQIIYSLKKTYTQKVVETLQEKMKNNEKNNVNKIDDRKIEEVIIQKAILIDTSLVAVRNMDEVIKKFCEDSIMVFTTLVIQEIKECSEFDDFAACNARKLLHIAIEEPNIVIPNASEANLIGWDEVNKDSLIIQTAIDVQRKYELKLITADKIFALKAKSQNLDCIFLKVDSNDYWKIEEEQIRENKKDELYTIRKNNFFERLEAKNEVVSLAIKKQKGFSYIHVDKEENEFPCYFAFDENGKRIDFQGRRVYVKNNTTFFKIDGNLVEKFKIQNCEKTKNAVLVASGNLIIEARPHQIDIEGIKRHIQF